MAKLKKDISRLDCNYTMTVIVNITRQFRFRMAIAAVFIKAAAFVLGCGVTIAIKEDAA